MQLQRRPNRLQVTWFNKHGDKDLLGTMVSEDVNSLHWCILGKFGNLSESPTQDEMPGGFPPKAELAAGDSVLPHRAGKKMTSPNQLIVSVLVMLQKESTSYMETTLYQPNLC